MGGNVSEKSDAPSTRVVGTTNLYENGQIRLIPMPTADPKDPLNMPNWRKWTAIATICFFGSLALSAEIIIGALIPVFLLEYSGVSPHVLNTIDFAAKSGGSSAALNPLSVVPEGVVPADLGRVTMLATIPLISNGIASYLLVPLSIAIGRRPVMLFAGVCAWAGGLWAGLSTSLEQHLAARAMQGLGAGAVEALIPLIIQDMVFIHQRNRAMSAIVASQGIIIIGLGLAAPYVASKHDWRWLYYITSGFGILAWLLLVGLLPETRWRRSDAELAGDARDPVAPGESRPALDYIMYDAPTLKTFVGFLPFGLEWRAAGRSMLDTLRTTLFPPVLWAVLANTVFIVANQAAGQITPFALLAQGWEFQYTGLSVVPFILATALVYVFGGPVADKVANRVALHRGGAREPEHHLLNLVFPFAAGTAGAFVFGWAGEDNVHWAVLLTGTFLIVFAFLTVMTILNVYIVESYPMWAGPVLVNVSSLRIILAFFLASQATVWVQQKGFLSTFAIYGEAAIVASLGIPAFYLFGKKVRMWTAGGVGKTKAEKELEDGNSLRSF